MTHPNHDLSTVKELIKVLNAGVEFYTQAKKNIDNLILARIFEKNILDKAQAVSELQKFIVADEGKIEDDNALSVELRESYTKVISLISTDKEHTYLSQLEEVEDKVLRKIDRALKQDLPPSCTLALNQIRSVMQANHDEMKGLKETTA
ncbi:MULTISPECIES: PA2169 family four-helix-bundle protein [Pseudoalteromonas]|uniref:DUF2383 domain-containing protein n=1 Tax=Pseudoalteromonas amylolytica TaxID=1859457 RepID=A0A1S1MPS3_9GAMM|nr:MULTISPECIES: PA2169 family four-helix-bundle protein [Pseudoalteromonas]MCF6436284.1 PA2169 family four-helix-bundle protein [Pseudoalteromonas sp. MMG022]OHU86791.1 hypothetical protein BFC16_14950 [Pseudoalteromonas sp. JW3]OHU88684.1 hypothetical protein BET10_17805 [Pseudoalteromonas amylolytica]